MKYLLDTHILLWALQDNPKLNHQARDIIVNLENELIFSVASIWEMAIKFIKELPNIHKDHFDRILIAQAKIEDFILITADEKIAKYHDCQLLII